MQDLEFFYSYQLMTVVVRKKDCKDYIVLFCFWF